MLRKIGRSSSWALRKASSPHAYQSTGLCACCRRYGLVSWTRRLVKDGALMGGFRVEGGSSRHLRGNGGESRKRRGSRLERWTCHRAEQHIRRALPAWRFALWFSRRLRSDGAFHRDRRRFVVQIGANGDLLAKGAGDARLDAQVEDMRGRRAIAERDGQAVAEAVDCDDAERLAAGHDQLGRLFLADLHAAEVDGVGRHVERGPNVAADMERDDGRLRVVGLQDDLLLEGPGG